jgi:hypothetical protein
MSYSKGNLAERSKHSKEYSKITEQINTIGITDFKEKVRKEKTGYHENYSKKCSAKRRKTNRYSTYARHIGILPKEVKLKPIYECLSAAILTNFNELNQDFKPPH